jgi:hypothetical protein
MAYMATGDKLIVTLERSDGTVLHGQAVQSCITWSQHAPDIRTTTMELVFLGDLEMSHREIAIRRTSSEWGCEWCNSANVRADMNCQSCGAPRSVLFD